MSVSPDAKISDVSKLVSGTMQWTERRLEIKFDHSLAIAGSMKTTTAYKIKWDHFDMLLSALPTFRLLTFCLALFYTKLNLIWPQWFRVASLHRAGAPGIFITVEQIK